MWNCSFSEAFYFNEKEKILIKPESTNGCCEVMGVFPQCFEYKGVKMIGKKVLRGFFFFCFLNSDSPFRFSFFFGVAKCYKEQGHTGMYLNSLKEGRKTF